MESRSDKISSFPVTNIYKVQTTGKGYKDKCISQLLASGAHDILTGAGGHHNLEGIGLNPLTTSGWGEVARKLGGGPARQRDRAGVFKLGTHTDFPGVIPARGQFLKSSAPTNFPIKPQGEINQHLHKQPLSHLQKAAPSAHLSLTVEHFLG